MSTNLLVNGDFSSTQITTSGSYFPPSGGWYRNVYFSQNKWWISSGKGRSLHSEYEGSQLWLRQTYAAQAGHTYRVTFTVDSIDNPSGEGVDCRQIWNVSDSDGVDITGAGTFSFDYTPTSAQIYKDRSGIGFRALIGKRCNMVIDDVSVVDITVPVIDDVVRVQADSDGKTKLRDVGNGVMQVQTYPGPPCPWCVDGQPARIYITLGSFVDCSGIINCITREVVWSTYTFRFMSHDSRWVVPRNYMYPFNSFCIQGLAVSLNNQTFQLPHSRACTFKKTFNGSFGSMMAYGREDGDTTSLLEVDYGNGTYSHFDFYELVITATDMGDCSVHVVIVIRGKLDADKSSQPRVHRPVNGFGELVIFDGYIWYENLDSATQWVVDTSYTAGDIVYNGNTDIYYKCTSNHTSSSGDEPPIGQDYKDCWTTVNYYCFDSESVGTSDLGGCVDSVGSYTIWADETAYAVGDIVKKELVCYGHGGAIYKGTRNLFECLKAHTSQAGFSGANEPFATHSLGLVRNQRCWRRIYEKLHPCGGTGEVQISLVE